MNALIIPYCAIMSGWSGGSLPGHKLFGKLNFMPEVLFAIGMAFPLFEVIGYYSILPAIWIYIFFQSGTWVLLPWDKEGVRSKTRSATLKPIADFIAKVFKVKFDSEAYAWIYAAMRGFLITLPIGGLGIILSPLAREIGSHAEGRVSFDPHIITELVEGAFFGINAYIAILVIERFL